MVLLECLGDPQSMRVALGPHKVNLSLLSKEVSMSLVIDIDIGKMSPHEAVILRKESKVKVKSSFKFRSTLPGIDYLLEKVEKAARMRKESFLLWILKDEHGFP